MATSVYYAASVPRFLRETRLGYLPLNCVIGSKITRGAAGSNLVFDIVMLQDQQFQRMRQNVGLQHVASPALQMGGGFSPGFVLADAKKIVVPAGEADPQGYARQYFMVQFGLTKPENPHVVMGDTLGHSAGKAPLTLTQDEQFIEAGDSITGH